MIMNAWHGVIQLLLLRVEKLSSTPLLNMGEPSTQTVQGFRERRRRERRKIGDYRELFPQIYPKMQF